MNAEVVNDNTKAPGVGSWIFALVLVAIGVANIVLVHVVPGAVYLLLSLLYFPPADAALRKRLGFGLPLAAKIILGVVVIWFTLGISDLAEVLGL